jgi:hypothetical protein
MKSLYVTSIATYSGKTAICLGIGAHMLADKLKVGYLKPLSLQPWRVGEKLADEDAAFAKKVLSLGAEPWELAPVVVTPELLQGQLKSKKGADLLAKVKGAYDTLGEGQDVLLVEGSSSLREGHAVGLPSHAVVKALGSTVVVVTKYREEMQVLDDILAAQAVLGTALRGAVINRTPAEAKTFINKTAAPFLEKHGIQLLGALPDDHMLAALTVDELAKTLDAEVLTKYFRPQALVENLTVGAMTADTALSRFRQYSRKAVITGGDRTDIQLAALETSTTCLILTGNLRPSPLVVKQAEEFGVAVMLVRQHTLEAVEAIERVYGKTRLGHTVKLKRFQDMLKKNFDFKKLYEILELKP